MADCKSAPTPSDPSQKLSTKMSKAGEDTSATPYREAVGSLLYLVQGTRPDIAFAVNDVSRYNDCHGGAHWIAVKRIFRYLRGTIDQVIVYEYGGGELTGFSDSDWASDIDTRRSCTGYVFTLAGGAISWGSSRQKTIALSSTEAEYMALCEATKEACWLRQFAIGLGDIGGCVTIWCDNQSAIALASEEMFRKRSKHLDIKHHFTRDRIQDGTVGVKYVPSADNAADCLTKAVVGPTMIANKARMGIGPE